MASWRSRAWPTASSAARMLDGGLAALAFADGDLGCGELVVGELDALPRLIGIVGDGG